MTGYISKEESADGIEKDKKRNSHICICGENKLTFHCVEHPINY